jgi:hypothetical protein
VIGGAKRARALASAMVLALTLSHCNNPVLAPMPGEYLGSFVFTGTLVVDAPAGPTTNCLLDGGLLFWPSVANFYAQVSWLPDAGVVFWQIQNGPLRPGTVAGREISVSTLAPAQVSSCGCLGEVTELVSLVAPVVDAGTSTDELVPPVLSWTGYIQDELAPNPSVPLTEICRADAGPGCGLDCTLVYAVVGTPGLP